MPIDPIDDLLSTPDGTVSPFDPLEAAVPQDVAQTLFRAMRDDARSRLNAHLDRDGVDGDSEGLALRRSQLQQSIDALDRVSVQRGPTVTLGCYPVDLAAENEFFDRLLDENPHYCDVSDDDLRIPRDRDREEVIRELNERIRELESRKPGDGDENHV